MKSTLAVTLTVSAGAALPKSVALVEPEATDAAARTARATRACTSADGLMSAAELAAADIAEADARAARQNERPDADGDGQLPAAEFASPPMPRPMFERVDPDGDGAITTAVADTAMEKMWQARGRHGGHHRILRDCPQGPDRFAFPDGRLSGGSAD